VSESATTIHLTILPPLDTCPTCGEDYMDIQHPMKPPGVVMMRLCRCTDDYFSAQPQVARNEAKR
jgi:hypothetical protein